MATTINDGTYFLGCVVSYENEDKEQEIIDGQQRITSLFLLLRAIYTKLMEADDKTDMAKNFISQIEPAIWRKDKLTGHVDYSSTLLMSRVVNNEGNEILRKILETGVAESNATDNYSKNYDSEQLSNSIKAPHRNAVRMLLKVLAYANQNELLPERWEIEHIFPQKWQTAYFPDVSTEVIQEKIEHIGNKLPFEKKLNIIAGNGYFSKKKKEYLQSDIGITKQIGSISSNDWTLDNITERDLKVSERIIEILINWNNKYQMESSSDEHQPSTEQLKQIELFKQNGWI